MILLTAIETWTVKMSPCGVTTYKYQLVQVFINSFLLFGFIWSPIPSTPLKIRMEPENEGLEDYFYFEAGDFKVNFPGCTNKDFQPKVIPNKEQTRQGRQGYVFVVPWFVLHFLPFLIIKIIESFTITEKDWHHTTPSQNHWENNREFHPKTDHHVVCFSCTPWIPKRQKITMMNYAKLWVW